MGVHDVKATAEAKKLLGIPEGEPVFILRAQDVLYPAIIAVYEQLYAAACRTRAATNGEVGHTLDPDEWAFADHIDACRENGRNWQKRNSERVKIPD